MKYTLPQKSVKKDYIFNMLGSTVNALVSVILLVVVSHIAGEKVAGMFSIAYSTAQMMYTVCCFEMRNIQVTDVKKKFSFAELLTFRVITCILMWAYFAVFCIVRNYSGEKLFLMYAVTLYMMLLAFSDLFQGNLHLNGYLSLAGKSLACEVAIAAAAFVLVLSVSGSAVLASCCMALTVLLWLFLYDIPYSNNFSKIKLSFDFERQKKVLLCALPLFLSTFMHQYIFNSSKYAIDSLMTEVDQSHYGYLSMPTFCINLLSIFVFRPQLVNLSVAWAEKRITEFKKTVLHLYAWVAIITVAALVGGYLLGIPVLEVLYGANLSGEKAIFMVLLLSGGVSAACTLTLTLFTTVRKQNLCLYAYAVTLIFALTVPKIAVSAWGLVGAAVSYLAEMVLLFAGMLCIFIVLMKKANGKENR